MTTMAALFGALPLAFRLPAPAPNSGAPLASPIVGGLIVSQMLTLYTTPSSICFFDRMRLRFQGKQSNALHPGTRRLSSKG